jgi:hypothetical protein
MVVVTGGATMGNTSSTLTVRRSVALPRGLVDEVMASAPAELQGNLNRLVTTALREYVDRRKEQAFAEAMAEMAGDPAIQRECASINQELMAAETDGLGDP